MALEQYDIKEAEQFFSHEKMATAFLAKMHDELHAIRQTLDVDAITIDEWKYEPNATLIQPLPEYDGPIVIQSILAVFPTTTTSAVISLGRPDRQIPIPISPPVGNSAQNSGTVTSPGALANIVTIGAGSLPAGSYDVTIIFNIAGTVAQGTDNSNVKFTGTAGPNVTLDNTIAAGNQTFGPFQVTSNGAQNLQVATINAGTAGSIYSATIIAVPTGTAGGAPGSAIFNPNDLRIRVGQRDGARNLIIAPAGAAYVNFFGYADKRVIDRL